MSAEHGKRTLGRGGCPCDACKDYRAKRLIEKRLKSRAYRKSNSAKINARVQELRATNGRAERRTQRPPTEATKRRLQEQQKATQEVANSLGYRAWNDAELELVLDPNLTILEIAFRLKRTVRAVQCQRARLRNGRKPTWRTRSDEDTVTPRRWTREERLLLMNPALEAEQLMRTLGRTRKSIHTQRSLIRLGKVSL